MNDLTADSGRPPGDDAPPISLTTGDAPPADLSRFGRAAIAYARRGLHVLPVDAKRGEPMLDGVRIGTRREVQIEALWRLWPGAAIGFETGPHGGVFAVIGEADRWDALERGRGYEGPVWRFEPVLQEMRLFAWSPELRGVLRSGELATYQLAVLGRDCWAPLPPMPEGFGRIEATARGAIAPAPAWLIDELRKMARAAASASSPAPSSGKTARAKTPAKPATKAADPVARRRAWARAGIDRELKTIKAGDGAAEALGRAAWALGRFVAGGDLDQADASAWLWKHARLRLIVDALGEAEVRKRIEEGLARGREKGPRVMSGAAATVG